MFKALVLAIAFVVLIALALTAAIDINKRESHDR